jgi:hypothetical protein
LEIFLPLSSKRSRNLCSLGISDSFTMIDTPLSGMV